VHLGHERQGHGQPLGDHPDRPRLYAHGHVQVARADRAAFALSTAVGLAAHQLVDPPNWHATILQLGREGVAQLMRVIQRFVNQNPLS